MHYQFQKVNKMKKKEEKVADNLLQDINTVISELEEAEMEKEASILHEIFIKLSKLNKINKR
jgi:hypothetical protein